MWFSITKTLKLQFWQQMISSLVVVLTQGKMTKNLKLVGTQL